MDKKTVGVVVGVVVIALGLLYVLFSAESRRDVPVGGEGISPSDATRELDGVDLGDLDKEFEAIDAEIKGL